MAKAPAFQFYPDDFLRDTQELSLAARGGWITLLCKMWYSVTPGRISWPITGYARTFGSTVDQARAVIDELRDFGVCDAETESNENITLVSRRMFRDGQERLANNNRQKTWRERHRGDADDENNADITAELHERNGPSLSFSLTSSSEDLKRLIDSCVREHAGIDPRIVETVVLETLIKWRRFGEKDYKPPPIKSVAYFADEIGHAMLPKHKLGDGAWDARLANRRFKALKLLFGRLDEGGWW